MRGLLLVLGLLVAPPALAGPIRVEIQPEVEVRDPFVVIVTGHYADFHNGHSRRWKEVPLRAGARRFVPLGPVNPLVNMGVSVRVYHPRFVSAYARSKKTPLLVRPVGFETFRPPSWRSVLSDGVIPENGGPNFLLGQALVHLQLLRLSYLPTVDTAEGGLAVADERLRGHLPLLAELAEAAVTRPVEQPIRRFDPGDEAKRKAYARSLDERDRKLRADVREELYRIREWLSLEREQRVAVRRLLADMRYARDVNESLMDESDRAEVAALLDRYVADRDAGRAPEPFASWTNPVNRVEYRVHVVEKPTRCSRLRVTADLTGVVPADLGEMTRQVDARFCREDDRGWGYEPS